MAQEYRIKYLETPDIPKTPVGEEQGGGGSAENAVLYTPQSLTDSQKTQARTNVGAGTYSKPSSGIPASDLESGVIPTVPQMATQADMSDWTNGKTVDAGTLKAVVSGAGLKVSALEDSVGELQAGKADAASVYTKSEVDQKLVGAMDYKGTKATVSALPTSGNNTGDVWHITADGSEWAWNGSAWEELGTAVDLSGYATKQWVEDKGYLTQHQSLAAYQTKAITDTGGYFSTDTVEGALQEIGAELAGVNTLIGTGVIT